MESFRGVGDDDPGLKERGFLETQGEKIMKPTILGLLLAVASQGAFAELDDSYTAPSPFQVSAEELESIRDQELPAQLRQAPLGGFADAINEKKISLNQWVERIQQKRITALCIGETHNDTYRKLIGESLLPKLPMATLSVEMVSDELDRLQEQKASHQEVEWLGADFDSVLTAAHSKVGPDNVFAIEQTKAQDLAALKEKISDPDNKLMTRDGFIAKNFLDIYKEDSLNVIVYGANHCSNFDKGLPLEVPMFRRIKNVIGSEKAESVLILPLSRRSHPVVAYFAAAGVKRETMVIPDFKSLPPEVFNYRFELIKYQQNYDTIIFMKDR